MQPALTFDVVPQVYLTVVVLVAVWVRRHLRLWARRDRRLTRAITDSGDRLATLGHAEVPSLPGPRVPAIGNLVWEIGRELGRELGLGTWFGKILFRSLVGRWPLVCRYMYREGPRTVKRSISEISAVQFLDLWHATPNAIPRGYPSSWTRSASAWQIAARSDSGRRARRSGGP